MKKGVLFGLVFIGVILYINLVSATCSPVSIQASGCDITFPVDQRIACQPGLGTGDTFQYHRCCGTTDECWQLPVASGCLSYYCTSSSSGGGVNGYNVACNVGSAGGCTSSTPYTWCYTSNDCNALKGTSRCSSGTTTDSHCGPLSTMGVSFRVACANGVGGASATTHYCCLSSADCNALCTPTTWTPDTLTVCSGTSFTQTSNCGTTRTATGTASCSCQGTAPTGTGVVNGPAVFTTVSYTPSTWTYDAGATTSTACKWKCSSGYVQNGSTCVAEACTDTSWTPDESAVCQDESFTQTSNCDTTRSSTGTKTCASGETCSNGECVTTTTALGEGPTAPSQWDAWANQDTIIITENSGTTLSDYPVRLNLPFQEGMNSNFSDIRFTDLNDNELSYWVEKEVDDDEIVVWVKVPSLPANQRTTIKLYFGNPDAEGASSMENTFRLADWAGGGFKINWKYSGYKSGRIAGWEDELTNFNYADSAWTRYVDISTDYVPICPPDAKTKVGWSTSCYDEVPNNLRWFVRKEFFMKPGVFYYSGNVDDDEVWSLISTDSTYQKIGGDEMDNDGHNMHSWTIRQVTVPAEGRYIFAGRGQDGSGDEYLRISYVGMSTNILYYRDIATKEPTAELKPGTWWNADWLNKREIVINNIGSTVYNYSLMIDLGLVDLENASASYSDLRFTNEVEAGKLDYWIEKNNGINVWVRVPEMRPGLNRIFMYYGNSNVNNESSLENTFKKASFSDFKINWKYSGYKSGRIAGWEDELRNFNYADSAWTRYVDMTTDYVPICPPDPETSGGWPPSKGCYDEAPNNVRWFVRKEFLFKPGEIAFNSYHDDDEVWSLISINNTVTRIGGDEMDASGSGQGSNSYIFVIGNEGRFIWAGRGQEGSGEERLEIHTAIFNNIYLRTIASPDPTASIGAEQIPQEGGYLSCADIDCEGLEDEPSCQVCSDYCAWNILQGCVPIAGGEEHQCIRNGRVDFDHGEECDPGNATVAANFSNAQGNQQTCVSQGYPAGTLSCTQECAFNYGLCGSKCRQEQDNSFWTDTNLSSKENCSVLFAGDSSAKECCPTDQMCANVLDEDDNEFNICIKTGVSRCGDYASEDECNAFDWPIAKDSNEELEAAGFLCEMTCGPGLPCNFTNCICGWDDAYGCLPIWELIEVTTEGSETLGNCTYTPVEGATCDNRGFKEIQYTASFTGVVEGCDNTSVTVSCFAATEIPFFGVWSFITAVGLIAGYYVLRKK